MVLLMIDVEPGLAAAGTVLVFLSGICASLGGVGGAALFIPILLLVAQVPEFAAIPVSMSAVFGGALAMNLYTMPARDASGLRPLINYGVALVLQPAILLGSVFGVRLNKIFPYYLIAVLLSLLLAFTSYKTLMSGIKMRRREMARARKAGGGVTAASKGAAARDEPLLGPGTAPTLVIAGYVPFEPRMYPGGLDGDGLLHHDFDEFDRIVRRDHVRADADAAARYDRDAHHATLAPDDSDDESSAANGVWGHRRASTAARPTVFAMGRLGSNGTDTGHTPASTGAIASLTQEHAVSSLTSKRKHDTAAAIDSRSDGNNHDDDHATHKPRPAALRRPQYPWRIFVVLGLSWVFVLAINIAVESAGVIACGSAAYWLVLCSAVPVLAVVTVGSVRWFVRQSEHDKQLRAQLGEIGDDDDGAMGEQPMEWNLRNTVLTVLASFVAGLVSALLGVGGSTIQGPLLLFVLKNPHHSSATSGFLLILSSSSAMVQYAALDRLPIYPALVYVTLGFAAGVLGHFLMRMLFRKYGSLSFITFFLAAYIGAGCVAMTVLSVLKATSDLTAGSYGFRSLCSSR